LFGENFMDDEFYVNVDGQVENLADGGWVLNQTVASTANPDDGWTISMTYGTGYNWEEWEALPGSQGYFQGCGAIEDLHEEWMYHILDEGTLTGFGAYEGTTLNLTHQPANAYFGLQIGEGASGKNANYGYVAWFLYDGEMNGSDVMGSGDIFGDLDCTTPVTVNRHYTATDCAGNTTEYSYSLVYSGEPCPEMTGLSGSDVAESADEHGEENGEGGDNDENPADAFASIEAASIRLIGLSPNPTRDESILRFVSENQDRINITIYAINGAKVSTLFEGDVAAGGLNQVRIPGAEFSAGMYQIRITGNDTQLTTKLLVTE